MSDLNGETARMLAVVKAGPGIVNVRLTEVDVPEAGPGFARLKVVASGICGTDIHIARDEYRYEAPVVMGHEVLGIVDQVGCDRDASLVGMRCVSETYYSTCEVCDWCRSGRRNLCPSRRSIGSFENGGFARYVIVPVTNLHPVPDEITDDEAVLAEPLACVTHSLLDPPMVCAGDRVLVTGPGTIGQLAAQVAAAMGGSVTLAGLPKDLARFEVAASLGVTTTTETPAEDFFDVVIECSGSVTAATAALRACQTGRSLHPDRDFRKGRSAPVRPDLVQGTGRHERLCFDAHFLEARRRSHEAKARRAGPSRDREDPHRTVAGRLRSRRRRRRNQDGHHPGLTVCWSDASGQWTFQFAFRRRTVSVRPPSTRSAWIA